MHDRLLAPTDRQQLAAFEIMESQRETDAEPRDIADGRNLIFSRLTELLEAYPQDSRAGPRSTSISCACAIWLPRVAVYP